MSNRHTQIALADAVAGMTLSDAVLDTKGNVLLPAGTELSAAMLDSLARHEIDTLAVAGAAVSAAEESIERDQLAARVNWLFRQPGTATGTGAPDAAAMPTATEVLHQYILRFRAGEST